MKAETQLKSYYTNAVMLYTNCIIRHTFFLFYDQIKRHKKEIRLFISLFLFK